MQWWLWIIFGIMTLVVEVFLPLDLFLIFIGMAFVSVGALTYFSFLDSIALQFFAASIFSVFFLYTLRPLTKKMFVKELDKVGDLKGEKVKITEDIHPEQKGKGEMRGSSWQVYNKTDGILKKGDYVEVSTHKSLTLIIE